MSIKKLREKIDKIDAAIIKKIAQRNLISKKIGRLKSTLTMKVMDKTREKQLMMYHHELCVEYQLDPALIHRLFKLIITNSRRLQK